MTRRATPLLRLLTPLLLLAAVLFAVVDPVAPGRAQESSDQGTVASLLSWALSTPANHVTVGQVAGALSSDVEVRDVRIADKDGVWLTVDRAKLVWSRTALFSRRLEIDKLEIDRLTIARKPVEEEADKAQAAEAPQLPALPVKLIVRSFAMKEMVLEEPVIGMAARITASGYAVLGRTDEGLSLKLESRRLDAPGQIDVNLTYAPQTGQLDLSAVLKEPAHGLVSHVIGLPGEPPVDLDVRGKGTIDDWAATLAFQSGPTVGANGQATIKREGPGRRIALDLTSRIEGLLPEVIAPAFAGTTALTGDILSGDDGSWTVRRFEVASRTARLTLGGTVDAAKNLDVALAIRAVPTDGTATKAGDATIGKLVLDVTAKGPATAPRIAGTLSAADIASPQLRLASADGRLLIEPPTAQQAARPGAGAVAAAALSSVSFDFKLAGFAPASPDLARAAGDTLDVSARGTANSDFTMDLDTARLTTRTLDASFTGVVGARTLKGVAKARLPELAAFSGLAGRSLGGSAELTANLDGDPGRYRIRAGLDGQLRDARVGSPPVDRLLAGTVAIKGVAERLPGGFGFSDLRIAGQNLTARLDGPATSQSANLAVTFAVPELKRADDRLSGKAAGQATLTGSLDRPDLAADLTVTDARSLGRPIPRLKIGVVAKDVTGAVDARLSVEGEADRKAVAGRAHVAATSGGWALDDLDVTVGSARLNGAVTLAGDRLATGALALAAGDLDDLSPLVLTPLKGDVNASIALAVVEGRQSARVQAKANRLSVAGVSLRRLDAAIDARDAWGRPSLDADVKVEQLNAGGTAFESVSFTSKGTTSASDFVLAAKGLGLDIESRGRILPGPPTSVELQSLSARRGADRLALAEPARLTFADGGVAFERFAIAAGKGRLTIAGKAGATLDITAQATAVPLSVADIVAPGLGLEGTLDGKVQLAGPSTAPRGSYALTLAKVGTRQAREAGLPSVDVKATGALADGRATVDASATAAKTGTLRLTGSLPIGEGALDLKLRGPLDAAVVNGVLATEGRRVTGRLTIDLGVTGTVANPKLAGSAALSGGTFEDVIAGIRLQAIEARLAAQGETVVIERFAAATRNGGTLSASGRVTVDPAAGFPADLRITGRKAELVSSPIVTASADLDLTITGPLARTPRIGGRVSLISMDIEISERLPEQLAPLPGTKYVRPGPAARARLAVSAAAKKGERAAPRFVATFDLAIDARNRIFVRGRGLQAELGGALRLTGTTLDPVAIGAFDLRNGRFDLAGQRIDLVRGKVSFQGDLVPSLDFLAQTQASDINAQILVTGRATEPSFTITSQPALPQDEVLSRLLFNRATGGLTGFQALQLAQTLAQLSGNGAGGFDALRKSLGVDSLDVSSGASGGPTVGLSRYLGPKVRLGVRAGATAADTGVGVDLDVTRRIKLRAGVGADGSASGGAAVEWEY